MVLHWEVGDTNCYWTKLPKTYANKRLNLVKIDTASRVTQMEKLYWFYTFTINLHHLSLLNNHVHLDIEVNAECYISYSFVTYLQ